MFHHEVYLCNRVTLGQEYSEPGFQYPFLPAHSSLQHGFCLVFQNQKKQWQDGRHAPSFRYQQMGKKYKDYQRAPYDRSRQFLVFSQYYLQVWKSGSIQELPEFLSFCN